MKTADIKIGQTYGYETHQSRRHPPSAYNNRGLSPITVKEIVKEKVRTSYNAQSTYRMATIVVGTQVFNGEVREVRVEPRHLVCAWDEVVEARKQAAKWKAEAEDKDAIRRAELDPLIAKVEAALLAKGYRPRARYLGVAYINSKTGEAVQDRPKAFDTDIDSGWEYVNVQVETVLDRQEILKTGSIKVPITLLADLLPPF